MEEIKMSPIGFVKNSVEIKKDVSWGEDTSVICLKRNIIQGLRALKTFLMRSFFSTSTRPVMTVKSI